VAFEALQTMDARMKGKVGYMALKLDMSKAYDRVEWDFLETIMLKIGFARRWVELLMVCVWTVSYSILINGQPHGKIVPTRGIRQGDPLSPYFFILCAEGLSMMLRRAELEGRITGLNIIRGGTRISHLLFADDSLLFCRSSIMEWAIIQELLSNYERASGQKLNREKTSIFFSKNTKREAKEFILSTAGVTSSAHYESYLGLPALIGRSKVSSFSVLKGRIWERMNGWKEKFLSQAGKEVLLKAVIQAIPTYTMSVFQLPKTLCKEVCSMMSKFWWGHKGNDSRVAWMKWSKMGRAKENGGLGFRDLEVFNLALLAKQGWRLIQYPDSLVARIFKEKYYPNGSFLDSNLGRRPSYAWRSIYNAKHLLTKGLVWRVGDGTSIKIWNDRWLPTLGSHKVQSPVQVLSADARVCDLLDTDTNWWKTDLVSRIFGVAEAEAICSIPVCPRTRQDKLVWLGTKHGVYTVRSAYHMGMENGVQDEGSCSNAHLIAGIWKGVWKVKCATVVKMFLWQACNNILPTKERLFKRHISDDPLCPICGLETETTAHILWSCPSAKDVWLECNPRIHKCTSDEMDFIYIMATLLEKLNEDQMQLVVTIARQIWFRRNSIVFGGEMVAPSVVVQRAKDQVEAWGSANKGLISSPEVTDHPPAVRWTKPPDGAVKINWDASVNANLNRMGAGVVVRDSHGVVLAMYCTTKGFVTSPSDAETVGAWAAVELAKRLGLQRVIFEGDALEIIQALTRDGDCWASYGQILNEIKSELLQQHGWCFQYVNRAANDVAHKLARLAFLFGEDREWTSNFPICVEERNPIYV
jgi:ribonuclease HI